MTQHYLDIRTYWVYTTGHNKFQKFLDNLKSVEKQKMVTVIAKIQKLGFQMTSR